MPLVLVSYNSSVCIVCLWQVLSKSLNASNVQVSSMSVTLAAAPAVPSRPVLLPPSYANLTSNASNATKTAFEPIPELPVPQPLFAPSSIANESSGRSAIEFTVPSSLRVLREPPGQVSSSPVWCSCPYTLTCIQSTCSSSFL